MCLFFKCILFLVEILNICFVLILKNRASGQKDRTPVKQSSSPAVTSSIVLRSTPRKRLLLNDPLESSSGEQSSPKVLITSYVF